MDIRDELTPTILKMRHLAESYSKENENRSRCSENGWGGLAGLFTGTGVMSFQSSRPAILKTGTDGQGFSRLLNGLADEIETALMEWEGGAAVF